jgi:hypothetical protein
MDPISKARLFNTLVTLGSATILPTDSRAIHSLSSGMELLETQALTRRLRATRSNTSAREPEAARSSPCAGVRFREPGLAQPKVRRSHFRLGKRHENSDVRHGRSSQTFGVPYVRFAASLMIETRQGDAIVVPTLAVLNHWRVHPWSLENHDCKIRTRQLLASCACLSTQRLTKPRKIAEIMRGRRRS